MLEYLYTDHAPIESTDSVGLMILADQFGLTRLVSLCELYITKEVERAVTDQIAKADIDVIGKLPAILFTSFFLSLAKLRSLN